MFFFDSLFTSMICLSLTIETKVTWNENFVFRRKDCLRQFLVVLIERKELELLIDLPYRDNRTVMESEVSRLLQHVDVDKKYICQSSSRKNI